MSESSPSRQEQITLQLLQHFVCPAEEYLAKLRKTLQDERDYWERQQFVKPMSRYTPSEIQYQLARIHPRIRDYRGLCKEMWKCPLTYKPGDENPFIIEKERGKTPEIFRQKTNDKLKSPQKPLLSSAQRI